MSSSTQYSVLFVFLVSLLVATNSEAAWQIDSIASSGDVGSHISAVLDPLTNNFALTYFDATNGEAEYASGVPGSWAFTTLDSGGVAGTNAAISVHSDGSRHVVYRDEVDTGLRYVGALSKTWAVTVEVVDSIDDVGSHVSAVLNPLTNDFALTYFDATNGEAEYASGVPGAWTFTTLNSGGTSGTNTAIAIHFDGKNHVVYRDEVNGGLRYSGVLSPTWTAVIDAVDTSGDVGSHVSATLNPVTNDFALGFFDATNGDMEFATGVPGTWALSTVEGIGTVGTNTSMRGPSHRRASSGLSGRGGHWS